MRWQTANASDPLRSYLLDRGLDLSLVEFLGDHPQLLGDFAAKGALRQGDLTCCLPSGRRIWSPLYTEDSRVAVVTDLPQGPLTLRCRQFW